METSVRVSLISGGGDKPYALGLLHSLTRDGVLVEFVGSDDLKTADVLADPLAVFFNLRGDQRSSASLSRKAMRVILYYLRLMTYSTTTRASLFHVLWANRFPTFERVLLMLYYKSLGKRVVFTAHNVNERERDGGDSRWNRLTLRALYSLVDHVFVHTPRMKQQLVDQFRVPHNKVSVIPFGINNTIPPTTLSRCDARKRLGLLADEKVILFFGNIASYKGLEYAVEAVSMLRERGRHYRLLIAGQVKNCQQYWNSIERLVENRDLSALITSRIEHIPDADVELYFKAADATVLPYTFIYQSGVLFLSYAFGVPVIVTNAGSLADDVIEGRTGTICKAGDANALADAIACFFDGPMFADSNGTRRFIVEFAAHTYSWTRVAAVTRAVYERIESERRSSRIRQREHSRAP
jgi:glycosyltransferase involved in cell wall biosynthesis